MIELEILSLQQRMDQDDPFEPIKNETILHRSYLKHQTPTWGHNKIRINKLIDDYPDWIWFPLPISRSREITFYKLMHTEDQHRSSWNDYDKGFYKFASYEIYLDVNVNYIERRHDTILHLVAEVGSIKTGLMLIFGLVLSRWQGHQHDQKLASALLFERQKDQKKDQ